METCLFDAIIVVTANDYERLQNNYPKLLANIPAERVLFVGSEDMGSLVINSGLDDKKAGFLNENDVLPFDKVHEVMRDALKDILQGKELPRGVTGWYYQQFLKMQYACICRGLYYLVWDGDTIPCKPFSMFRKEDNVPYLDLKQEYHEEYFRVMSKLLPGMGKYVQKSFISEHMLISCEIMKELIHDIEKNDAIRGTAFWEKIIYAIDVDKLQSNSFSEFETYGTYVTCKHPSAYCFRNWHSFRYGGCYFDPNTISDADYEWLGRDFYAISFEKGHTIREDHRNLFDNPRYQEKLSARKMLEIAQEEALEGYQEVWD